MAGLTEQQLALNLLCMLMATSGQRVWQASSFATQSRAATKEKEQAHAQPCSEYVTCFSDSGQHSWQQPDPSCFVSRI